MQTDSTTRKKIAILGPATPFRGGIAQFTHNLAEALSKTHDVSIFTYIKQYPKWLFPGKSQMEDSDAASGIPTTHTLTPYNPCTFTPTAKQIIEAGTEILIIQYWIPYFCPAYIRILDYIKKHSKIKVYILCHNVKPHEYWLFGGLLTKAMLKRADRLVVLSQTVESSLRHLGYENILRLFHPLYEVEPNADAINGIHPGTATIYGCPTASYKYLKIPQKPTVLYFGFIKKYKGVDILLKSIPFVSKRISGIQFVIAGDVYARRDKYKQMAQSIGGDHVIYRGEYIPQSDVPHYFAIADIVVVPYRSATQSGIVSLAYSYRKPVIVSDVDGLKEMIEVNKTGLLFESENPKDLAEKICLFFQKKNDFRQSIESMANCYTWSVFAENLSKDFG